MNNTATITSKRVIGVSTHCSLDCEELGGHTSEHTICDRCGAHVHKRVFEIERRYSDGTVDHLAVGTECFKDVMGYSWKKAHDKAKELFDHFHKLISGWNTKRSFLTDPTVVKVIKTVKIYPGRYPELAVPRVWAAYGGHTWGSVCVKTKYGFTKSVIAAGEDLGLWRQNGGRELPGSYDLTFPTKK